MRTRTRAAGRATGISGRRALVAALCLLAAGMTLAASPATAAARSAQPGAVSSVELIENPERYNGRRVVYEGEAVGEILRRGDSAWLTLNDDEYGERPFRVHQELKGGNTGIGVYGPYDLAARVTRLGSYDSLGDKVRVEGTFHEASPDHGGDLMIEFDSLTVVRRGHPLGQNHVGRKLLALAALAAVSLLLGYLLYKSRRKLAG